MEYGTCPRDRPFPNDLEEVRLLSLAKLHAFDYGTHGQFFWNFRTEFEPRWDYLQVRLSRRTIHLMSVHEFR